MPINEVLRPPIVMGHQTVDKHQKQLISNKNKFFAIIFQIRCSGFGAQNQRVILHKTSIGNKFYSILGEVYLKCIVQLKDLDGK